MRCPRPFGRPKMATCCVRRSSDSRCRPRTDARFHSRTLRSSSSRCGRPHPLYHDRSIPIQWTAPCPWRRYCRSGCRCGWPNDVLYADKPVARRVALVASAASQVHAHPHVAGVAGNGIDSSFLINDLGKPSNKIMGPLALRTSRLIAAPRTAVLVGGVNVNVQAATSTNENRKALNCNILECADNETIQDSHGHTIYYNKLEIMVV